MADVLAVPRSILVPAGTAWGESLVDAAGDACAGVVGCAHTALTSGAE